MRFYTERDITAHVRWWNRVEHLAIHYGWSGEKSEARDGIFGAYKYSDASAASLKAALEAALPYIPKSDERPRDPSWEFGCSEDVLWGLAGSQGKLQELIQFLGGGAFKRVTDDLIVQDPMSDFGAFADEVLKAAPSMSNQAEHAIAGKRESPNDPLSTPLGDAFYRLLATHLGVHVAAITGADHELVAALEKSHKLLMDHYEKVRGSQPAAPASGPVIMVSREDAENWLNGLPTRREGGDGAGL